MSEFFKTFSFFESLGFQEVTKKLGLKIEHAENASDVLSKINLSKKPDFDYSDIYKGGVASTESKPKILIEEGASFCTLMLFIDKKGNAVTEHCPYIGHLINEDGSEDLELIQSQLSVLAERTKLVNHVLTGEQRTVFVGGMNTGKQELVPIDSYGLNILTSNSQIFL